MGFPQIYPVIIKTKSYLKSYNFYIVKDRENVYLIDAGIDTDECWDIFNNELKNNNISIHDIDFILLTHHHVDHIGLINRIHTKNDIPVYVNPKAVPHLKRNEDYLNMRIDFFERLYNEMGCGVRGEKRISEMKQALVSNKDQAIEGPFHSLTENDMIGRFRVLTVPGHASDHIAFYDETSGQIFLGDNLFSHMNSNPLIEPDENGELIQSVQQYEHTLNKLNDLYLTTVFPGHGKVINQPYDLIKKRQQQIINKSGRIKQTIINDKLTPAQIARHLYGGLYDKLFYFVMSEVIGHLNRLYALNEVAYDMKNDVKYYYVV